MKLQDLTGKKNSVFIVYVATARAEYDEADLSMCARYLRVFDKTLL